MTVTEQLSALESILAHGDLHSLFQPIVSLSERRILGYEALTRGPSNSPLHAPLALFSVARNVGRLSELELLARKSACRHFRGQQLSGKLFPTSRRSRCSNPATSPGARSSCCRTSASPRIRW